MFSSGEGGRGPPAASPEKGYEVDWRAGAPLPRGQAELVGVLHIKEGKSPGRSYSDLVVFKGVYKKDRDRVFSKVCCNTALHR